MYQISLSFFFSITKVPNLCIFRYYSNAGGSGGKKQEELPHMKKTFLTFTLAIGVLALATEIRAQHGKVQIAAPTQIASPTMDAPPPDCWPDCGPDKVL